MADSLWQRVGATVPHGERLTGVQETHRRGVSDGGLGAPASDSSDAAQGTVSELTTEVLRMLLVTKLKAATRVSLLVGLCGAFTVALLGLPGRPTAVMANPTAPPPRASTATAKERGQQARLEALWVDLADIKEPKALKAAIALAATPKETTEFFKGKLKPVPEKIDMVKVKAWIADLEGDTLSTRDRAAAELRHIAPLIEANLAEAHKIAKTEIRRHFWPTCGSSLAVISRSIQIPAARSES